MHLEISVETQHSSSVKKMQIFRCNFLENRYKLNEGDGNGSIPRWPMNAVSISEAMGSAAKAIAAGTAILSISEPSSSILKTSLQNNPY